MTACKRYLLIYYPTLSPVVCVCVCACVRVCVRVCACVRACVLVKIVFCFNLLLDLLCFEFCILAAQESWWCCTLVMKCVCVWGGLYWNSWSTCPVLSRWYLTIFWCNGASPWARVPCEQIFFLFFSFSVRVAVKAHGIKIWLCLLCYVCDCVCYVMSMCLLYIYVLWLCLLYYVCDFVCYNFIMSCDCVCCIMSCDCVCYIIS